MASSAFPMVPLEAYIKTKPNNKSRARKHSTHPPAFVEPTPDVTVEPSSAPLETADEPVIPANATDVTVEAPAVSTATTVITTRRTGPYSKAETAAFFAAPWKCRALQLSPRPELLLPGEHVSLDVEFQNRKNKVDDPTGKWQHRLGHVSLVNTAGDVVLDCYAAYPKEENVSKLMPKVDGVDVFGMDHRDLLFKNGAVPAAIVEKWVADTCKGRTVIVHGGKHDLTCLIYETDAFNNAAKVVDTQSLYSYLQSKDGQPSLRTAALAELGIVIQEGRHTACEDAQTAMKLYLRKHPYDRQAEKARIQVEAPETLTPAPVAHQDWIEKASRRRRQHGGNGGHGKDNRNGQVIRGIQVVKAPLQSAESTPVQAFDTSIEDTTAFPALGALATGKKGRR